MNKSSILSIFCAILGFISLNNFAHAANDKCQTAKVVFSDAKYDLQNIGIYNLNPKLFDKTCAGLTAMRKVNATIARAGAVLTHQKDYPAVERDTDMSTYKVRERCVLRVSYSTQPQDDNNDPGVTTFRCSAEKPCPEIAGVEFGEEQKKGGETVECTAPAN